MTDKEPYDGEGSEKVDPVAVRAREYAVAATDKQPKHAALSRFMWVMFIIILVVATFAAIVGALNTIYINSQNHKLAQQQQCLTQLVKSLTVEENARSNISADDRRALTDLVNSITRAKSSAEVARALHKFKVESHTNDVRRSKYPIPDFSKSVCVVGSKSVAMGSYADPGTYPPTKTPHKRQPRHHPKTPQAAQSSAAPRQGPPRTTSVSQPSRHVSSKTQQAVPTSASPILRPSRSATASPTASPSPTPSPTSTTILNPVCKLVPSVGKIVCA